MNDVLFDPEAKEEFIKAVCYYEACQEGLGNRFRLAVESSVRKISEAPLMYRVVRAPFRRHLVAKFPYSVIYTIEPDHIRIVAVAHNKRKPGYWLKRTPDGT